MNVSYSVYKLTQLQLFLTEKIRDHDLAYGGYLYPGDRDIKGWESTFGFWIPPSYREGLGYLAENKQFSKLIDENSDELEKIPQNAYQWYLQKHNLPEGSEVPNPTNSITVALSLIAIRVLQPLKYYIAVIESICTYSI